MNTSNLADISQIIGSIAVVITLIFLILQIRQNTRAIEASTRQASLDADTAYLNMSVNNPEMLLAVTKPDMTDRDTVQLIQSLALFIRGRENDFAQYQRGVLDKATWERYKSSLIAVLSWERNRNFWNNSTANNTFDPDFVREVNRMIEKIPMLTMPIQDYYRQLLDKP